MKKGRGNQIVRMALGVLGYEAAFGVFGFLMMPLATDAAAGVRIGVSALVIAGAWALVFFGAAVRGERDCAVSQMLDKLRAQGMQEKARSEENKRFWRMKAVWAALLGGAPLLLVAVFVAVTAQPYVYALQGTPTWMSSYLARPEIGDALAYLGDTSVSVGVQDYATVAVRFFLFAYVSLFGSMSDAASLLFDRLCPLLALLLPAVYAVGYQFGPVRRTKAVRMIEEAKRRPRKRLKKEARNRLAGKGPEKKELI